ncbi:hypothetical protein W02_09590 [Nitrospira sp. KM1]|uniref:hypothetical protein n=1 Tax=Nitrospira sp. KM1 TaxID=1936990 RepID=UPI0013A7AC9A|nr:hypothetical protein [Nitrospira sp. KM1]BCA53819.1 hypothetical protein W02_09590 [Nitrospira sp. KM1]
MTAYAVESIESRIAWCRQQKMQSQASPELERWDAEEEGLRDALLNKDHTNKYKTSTSAVYARYMMGLQDGLALIRAAAANRSKSFG